jgi:hypothetical protein
MGLTATCSLKSASRYSVIIYKPIASNDIEAKWIWKDLEGSQSGIIWVNIEAFTWTDKVTRKKFPELPLPEPRSANGTPIAWKGSQALGRTEVFGWKSLKCCSSSNDLTEIKNVSLFPYFGIAYFTKYSYCLSWEHGLQIKTWRQNLCLVYQSLREVKQPYTGAGRKAGVPWGQWTAPLMQSSRSAHLKLIGSFLSTSPRGCRRCKMPRDSVIRIVKCWRKCLSSSCPFPSSSSF